MGQEPNIRLGFEDLPRATAKPSAPKGWSPQRPGDMGSPAEVPWGGSFGTPGPDTGFAYTFVKALQLPGGDRLRSDLEATILAVVAARASAVGRAPTAPDATVAIELLGLDAESASSFSGIAHQRGRLADLVAAIPLDRLTA